MAVAAPADCRLTKVGNEPAVELRSGRLSAAFLPQCGMLGASLRFDGEEYLSLHGGLRTYRGGHTTGMPILHPWANRLEGFTYQAAGVGVSLQGAPRVHTDGSGLPIHGTMAAEPDWRIDRAGAGRRARLRALFAFDQHPDLLESFPYPHHLTVDVEARDEVLTVATTVTATTDQAVPVAFGWHPYFTLPGVRRAELAVLLPKRRHVLLDSQQLPTGAEEKEAAEAEPLGSRIFDDAYRLTRKDRVLGLGGRGRGLTMELDAGYRFAQVYAPAGKRFVALEPMTAPANALVTGDAPLVGEGESFTASFRIAIGHG